MSPDYFGLVSLPLIGPKGKKDILDLHYTLHIASFPLNILSGERLYRAGGSLNGNTIREPGGDIVSVIDMEK